MISGVSLAIDPGTGQPELPKRWSPAPLLILAIIAALLLFSEIYFTVHALPPLGVGLISLLMIWAVIFVATRKLNPFVIAVGWDNRLSLSIWQTAMWFFVVVYAFNVLVVYNAEVRVKTQSLAATYDDRHAAAATALAEQHTAEAAASSPDATVKDAQTKLDEAHKARAAATDQSTVPNLDQAVIDAMKKLDDAQKNAKPLDTRLRAALETARERTRAEAEALNAQKRLEADASGSPYLPDIDFPQSILLVLGFSVTSLLGAAGIAAAQSQANSSGPPDPDKPDLSIGYLIADDNGRFNLTRFQNVVWTLVSLGVFILSIITLCATVTIDPIKSLPSISNALVLLMGLGQVTYLGGKLVLTGKPVIQSISDNATAMPGQPVTITGYGFGEKADQVAIYLSGQKIDARPDSCTDTAIAVKVPATDITKGGAAWPPQSTVRLTAAVGALQTDAVELVIYTKPFIRNVSRTSGAPKTTVTLTGGGYAKDDKGAAYQASVFMSDKPIPANAVKIASNTSLTFEIPPDDPASGKPWVTPAAVKLSVGTTSWQSDAVDFTVA